MIRRHFLAQLLAAPLAFVAAWKAKLVYAPVKPPLAELAALNFESLTPVIGSRLSPDVFAPLEYRTMYVPRENITKTAGYHE